MGYTTSFIGVISINKKLDPSTYEFLVKLNQTRRMARRVAPKYGVEGEFYVKDNKNVISDNDNTIIDYNRPPSTQPSLWCDWKPTDDKRGIEWDYNEKFYSSADWMKYIIDKILGPKGYICNGTIEAQGEDVEDHWYLIVKDNVVSTESVKNLRIAKERLMIYETPKEDLPLLINHPFLSEENRDLYNKFIEGDTKK